MEKELKILFLEDNPSDVELIQREITKNGIKFAGKVVETKKGFADALNTFKPDIILSDYSLPQYNGMQALILRNEMTPAIPFILVTGSNNEEVAVNCMKAGADDYILKQSLARLGSAIKSAIEKRSNIDSRTRAEDALRKSEERFQYAALATKDVIYDWDLSKKEVWLSESYSKLFGHKELTYKFDEWKKNIHPEDIENTISLTDSVINNDGTNWTCEYRFKKADGSYAYILDCGYVLRDSEGNPIRLVGAMMDFTERKQSEMEIKKLSSAVEQSPVSIMITDLKGNIEYVNPKFVEVTGYTFEEAIGKNPRILKTGETPKEEYKKLWNTITAGEEWRGEFHNKKKNGEYYWESASISAIRNNDGLITNYLAVKEDITDKKLKETELIEAKEQAEEMSRLKSNFLANMSHELRTPMVAILGFSELLLDSSTESETRRFAEMILNGGRRLTNTLNLILDLSRAESSKTEVNLEKGNISDFVRAAVKLYEQEAVKKNLKITSDIADVVFAEIDCTILEKVLDNIVQNAVKFTDEGEIRVFTGYEMINNEEYAFIKVEDTGIGIPDDMKEVIFEPFRQASEGRSRHYEGTGLGLTITKKYVELMNGSISVSSKVGKGSTFTVKFKGCKETERKEEMEAARVFDKERKYDCENKKTGRILIVEDDDLCIEMLVGAIKRLYKYDVVNSGEEAIEIVNKHKYDVILMDIGLKEMSGLEAVKIIREMKEYKKTPIVAVTAYAMVGDEEDFLSKGCSHYISKPYEIKALLEMLKEIVVRG